MHPTTLLRTKTDPGSPDTVPTVTLTLATFVQPDANRLWISFSQTTDAAPTVQLADNTTLATVSVCYSEAGNATVSTALTTLTETDHPLEEPLIAIVPPGVTVGVYLSALTSPNASTERVHITVKPYRE